MSHFPSWILRHLPLPVGLGFLEAGHPVDDLSRHSICIYFGYETSVWDSAKCLIYIMQSTLRLSSRALIYLSRTTIYVAVVMSTGLI